MPLPCGKILDHKLTFHGKNCRLDFFLDVWYAEYVEEDKDMSRVHIVKSVTLMKCAQTDINPIQSNVMVALFTNGGSMSIADLIDTIRRSNSGYKFVEETRFYRAIAMLHNKNLVVYG